MDKKLEKDKDKYIKKLLLEGKSYRFIKRELNTGTERIKKVKDELIKSGNILLENIDKEINEMTDKELIEQNVKYKMQLQKFMDTNRIERKSFREYARINNVQRDLNYELIRILETYSSKLQKIVIKHEKINTKAVGIVHLTDLHFNELVDLPNNKYDFTVASKRLKKYVEKSKLYLKTFGITNILIAFTGDILNSDRRLDEILNNITNRTKASILATYLLEQVILDYTLDFNVSVSGVVGNESRIPQEIGWGNGIASDNYDYMIFEILKRLFEHTPVNFYSNPNDPFEQVINVANQNILLLHGHQRIFSSNYEKSIQQIKGKYASQGIIINYILTGHLHSCRIGDTYARGSSLIGANGYSDNGLVLESRASQNLHLIYTDGSRDSIKIDLQDIKDIKGYAIEKELETYHAKSLDKLRNKTTIFKVII